MTTLEQLKQVALHHFATYGYEGTSLANIAKDVGIKKPSIYAYFSSKDSLFLQICEDTWQQEISAVKQAINRLIYGPFQEVLHHFLKQSITRFYECDSTKFMLLNSFLPPAHLHEEVINKMYNYLDHLEELFLPVFIHAQQTKQIHSTLDAYHVTIAFLGIMDSLYVEMLYGNEQRLNKRFDAAWTIFWDSIKLP